MKNKLFYVITIFICLFFNSILTFVIVDYKIDKLDLNKEKVVKEVSIVEENTIKESVSKVYDSTVLVETYVGSRLIGSGTGFVYKTDDKYGYIMTNHHVIETAKSIKVTNTAGVVAEATLLGSDEYADIAVLQVDLNFVVSTAEIGKAVDMEIGDTVFTIGSPLGSEYMGTVTKGILSGKDRTVSVSLNSGAYRMEVLQTDAAVNPGNSGGPLVNVNGEVIGIISLKLVENEIEGMGFAIPIEIAMNYAPSLEKGEDIKRPVIGVELADVDNTYSLYLNKVYLDDNISYGSVILKVEDGYPAATAGLKKGDVIIAIDDNKIEDSSHLRYLLYKYEIGSKIKLKVIRDGKQIEIELTLDKANEG